MDSFPTGGQVLNFPLKKGAAQMDLDTTTAPPLEVEWPTTPSPWPQKSSSEERSLDKQRDELPPFVIKMRKLSAVCNEIEHLRKLSLEMSYYLHEIDIHSRQRR